MARVPGTSGGADREAEVAEGDRHGSHAASHDRRDNIEHARERQRDEFGGFNWGAAFFGWLVAVGIATLLTAALSAAGAATGLTQVSPDEAT